MVQTKGFSGSEREGREAFRERLGQGRTSLHMHLTYSTPWPASSSLPRHFSAVGTSCVTSVSLGPSPVRWALHEQLPLCLLEVPVDVGAGILIRLSCYQ